MKPHYLISLGGHKALIIIAPLKRLPFSLPPLLLLLSSYSIIVLASMTGVRVEGRGGRGRRMEGVRDGERIDSEDNI